MKLKYKGNRRKGRKKNTYKLHSNVKPALCILIFILTIVGLYYIIPDSITLTVAVDDIKREEIKEVVKEVLTEQETYVSEETINTTTEVVEEKTEEVSKPVEETVKTESNTANITNRGTDTIRTTGLKTTYRITSYHPGDGCASGTKTGSGKTTSDFNTMKIGNKNVYTYKGKIVVAAATEELYRTGYSTRGAQNRDPQKHYFRYNDTLTLTIDGTEYEAIVLDSCGASMWTGEYRIDIYVPSASDVINRSNVTIKI